MEGKSTKKNDAPSLIKKTDVTEELFQFFKKKDFFFKVFVLSLIFHRHHFLIFTGSMYCQYRT